MNSFRFLVLLVLLAAAPVTAAHAAVIPIDGNTFTPLSPGDIGAIDTVSQGGLTVRFAVTQNTAVDLKASGAFDEPGTGTMFLNLFADAIQVATKQLTIGPNDTSFLLSYVYAGGLAGVKYELILVDGVGHPTDPDLRVSMRVTPVPVPAALPLMGSALLGLAAFLRRRRASA